MGLGFRVQALGTEASALDVWSLSLRLKARSGFPETAVLAVVPPLTRTFGEKAGCAKSDSRP